MADILKLAPKIAKLEGKYVNDPVDRGGCTNMGVTLGAYQKYINPRGTCEDVKRMTHADYAKVLRKYWDRWKADQIKDQQVADLLVDWVFHSGAWGIKIPQSILGVKVDGIVGPETIAAVNRQDPKEFHQKVWDRRKLYLENIVRANPVQKRFINGWLNRLNDYKWK